MEEKNQRPSFWHVLQSVLAAMFGVQSDKARERDFQYGRPWHYVIVGLVMVALFVLTIIAVVRWIVSTSQIT